MSLAGDFELDYRDYLRSRREASVEPALETVFLGARGAPPGTAGPCGDSQLCLDSCGDGCTLCGDAITAYDPENEARA